MALLDRDACGLACTRREEAGTCCPVVREAGSLYGRPTSELGQWARSLDAIAAAVGLATPNALIEPPLKASDVPLLDLLEMTPDDVAGMVGMTWSPSTMPAGPKEAMIKEEDEGMVEKDCASCDTHVCRDGVDCFGLSEQTVQRYAEADALDRKLTRAAAKIMAQGYMRWQRPLEIIHFADTAGSDCCKACRIPVSQFGFDQIRPDDPRGLLAEAGAG